VSAPLNELHPTATSQHRFHFLDALRGIASVLVVYKHAPLYIRFRPVENSYLAVDFFFCLSGFVIAFSYEKRLQETLTLGRFLVARAIRLYPTYLLGIAFGTLKFFAFGGRPRITHTLIGPVVALIFLQTLMLPPLRVWPSPNLFPLDFPGWSMFFEMLANLSYAWMLRRRLASTGKLVAIILISLLVIIGWLLHGRIISVGSLSNRTSLLGVFRVAFSFLIGVLIFRLFRRQGTPHWTARRSGLVALAAALLMIFLLIGPLTAMRTRMFTLICVATVFPCIVYVGARCRLSAVWHRPCTFLGELSYPLYLLHVPCMALLSVPWVMQQTNRHPGMQSAEVPVVILIASAVSVLASKYYDVPVRKYLTRLYNAHLLKRPDAVNA
jgi:peptidoglycan/LPS O-acetylase OafA/YrhL